MFKADIGDEVGLHYDTGVLVCVGDFIQTRTGRCYEVIKTRRQEQGIHKGRYHLRCIVVKEPKLDKLIHPLVWYRR